MTSIRTSAFGSDGQLLIPQRSKLDTFPIVKRKDEAAHGTYRTKETILAIYAALAESQRTGQLYETSLNPPPADPRVAHPPRTETLNQE